MRFRKNTKFFNLLEVAFYYSSDLALTKGSFATMVRKDYRFRNFLGEEDDDSEIPRADLKLSAEAIITLLS